MSPAKENMLRSLSTKQKSLEVTQEVHVVFVSTLTTTSQCSKGYMCALMLARGASLLDVGELLEWMDVFFKGACNGELICSLGRDANNQIYPVAWAVVEKETEDSWTWFLGLLQKDLQVPIGGRGWVIVSAQQKGLLNAIAMLFLEFEHRMCTRHIYANWRKKYRNKDFQKPFWMCAKVSNVPFFNYCRAKLAQLTPAGAKDMMNTNPKH
ncbi:hypothetical protein C2845_PM07G09310 [Panicum miliaceum]|uniref:MULE transposase domain-containing protein n=1 Tax=Panicum miliaceum TaxID=4540 RepID=A0A3L6SGH5_PANMI|nr:hypothetical protein C2845_PM07G09310 [Panicum miliaceum]